jgi:hypothetical protein
VQQLLIEGLMLSSMASLLGVTLAMLTLRAFEHGLQTQFSIYTTLTPNLRVLDVLLLLTVISAVTSSVWPRESRDCSSLARTFNRIIRRVHRAALAQGCHSSLSANCWIADNSGVARYRDVLVRMSAKPVFRQLESVS